MPSTQLVWLKRDLRVDDHRPLLEAARRGPCVVLYIYEPEIMSAEDYDVRHFSFVKDSLKAFEIDLIALGGRLVTRRGEAVSVLKTLYADVGFEGIWSHEETGNAITFARDLRVKAWTKSMGLPWTEFRQFGVIRGLKNRDGWARQWNQMMAKPMVKAPDAVGHVKGVWSEGILEEGVFQLPTQAAFTGLIGGTPNGRKLLKSFLWERGGGYQYEMSSPVTAENACSRLSAHLAYGTISMKLISQSLKQRRLELKAGGRRAKGDTWLRSVASFDKRLHWHCHFIQKLESQPDLEWKNMAPSYDGLRENDFDAERFERWCTGETGYPMVDACMRFLRQGGWLNFRMRAMLVSFASYHLWLDWRPTSRFLARQFVDYEPGIHYSQMQMQSGTTGINAVRIYSPIKQVLDHDPQGVFIKRWVPELAGVPSEHIAQPALMSWDEQQRYGCLIGVDYPTPIVDHRQAVLEAKSKVYSLRRTASSRAEAQDVFRRHGSRRRSTRGRASAAKRKVSS